LLVAVGLCARAGGAAADSLNRGSVSLEGRAFQPDDVPETEDYGVALTTRLELASDPWPHVSFVLSGLARLDAVDGTRNIVTPEDLYGAFSAGRFTLRVGFEVLNWSATEAFHPADIMNSRNFDSDAESPEKIGEPMVETRFRLGDGAITVFFMPARIAPKLPGERSRLSPLSANAAGLALGEALWVERDGTLSDSPISPQGAIYVSQTFGKVDVAVHVVDHNDRTHPTFTLDTTNGLARPTYHTVTQTGLSYTQVIGSFILKLEGAARFFREPGEDIETVELMEVEGQSDHGQAAAGVEYGWTTESGRDVSIVLEGQAIVHDDREVARQLDVLQGDVLIVYRYAFNDLRGRELRLGLLTDVERPSEYVASARWAQSMTDVWSIVAVARSARIVGKDFYEGDVTLLRNF
jgi:hypothetical protein